MPKSNLSDQEIEQIKKDGESGMKINAIATKHATSWGTVSKILGGKKIRSATLTTKGPIVVSTANSFRVNLTAAAMDTLWNSLTPTAKAKLLEKL